MGDEHQKGGPEVGSGFGEASPGVMGRGLPFCLTLWLAPRIPSRSLLLAQPPHLLVPVSACGWWMWREVVHAPPACLQQSALYPAPCTLSSRRLTACRGPRGQLSY